MRPSITIILARSENGVIGRGNSLPWHLPEDLQHFKTTTMNHAIVMGRRTFESIGRALPGRRTIVVTKNKDWSSPDVERVDSLGDAINLARKPGVNPKISTDEIFVIGGARLFKEAAGVANRAIITEIDAQIEGDVYFHDVDLPDWMLTADSGPQKSVSGLPFRIYEWVRVR